MNLQQSFEVKAPLERVWETLIDVERVAPCLPGAELTESADEGTYRGNFTVRLGPTTATYSGELTIGEVDESAHRAVMRATGQDKRGQGSAKATIVSEMRAEGDVTKVDVETELTITGRLARFGRGGMMQDVSNRLLKDFAECLQRTIEAPQPEAAAGAADASQQATAAGEAQQAPSATGAPSQPQRPPAKALGGFSLFFRALTDRLRRVLGRR